MFLQEHIKFLFKLLDDDRSGSIRIAELKRFISLDAAEEGNPDWANGLLEDDSGHGGGDDNDFAAVVEAQRHSKAKQLMRQFDWDRQGNN